MSIYHLGESADMVGSAKRRRFVRLVGSLSKLMEEIHEELPDARYYLDGTGNLHLMVGNTHDGILAASNQKRIAVSAPLLGGHGGDW